MVTPVCSYDTTAPVTITQNVRTANNTYSVTPTSSTSDLCSGSSIALQTNGTMPSGTTVRKWIFMDNNNGIWNEIGNATNGTLTHTNTTVIVPTIRAYRFLINNPNACSYDTSGTYFVNINPVKRGNIGITPVLSSVSSCSFTTPLNASISGYNGTIVKWLMKSNGGDWTDFPYLSSGGSVNDYTILSGAALNRSYRAIISNTFACTIDSSNAVSYSLTPFIFGNLNNVVPVASTNKICYSQAVNLRIDTPVGYSIGRWIYRNNNEPWQIFPDSSGSSSITDVNTLTSVTMNRTYRVLLFNSSNCRTDSSGMITVTINPKNTQSSQTNITPTISDVAICSGSVVNLNLNIPSGMNILKWIYSDNGNNGPWYIASNSFNASNYTHSATHQNVITSRLYKAVINDSLSCGSDTTLSVTTKINPLIYRNNISLNISAPDSVCTGNPITLKVSPGLVYKPLYWLYSLNKGEWNRFNFNTSDTMLTDNESTFPSGTTKDYKVLLFNEGSCLLDTVSSPNTVNIKLGYIGTSATSVFISNGDTICSGNQITVYSGGTVERWLYSDGNKQNWQPIASVSGSPLVHNATTVTTSGWRYYRAIHRSMSCLGDSSMIDSIFIRNYTSGYGQIAPTASIASLCSGSTLFLVINGNPGVVQSWMYRDSLSTWKEFAVTSNTSITESNTIVTKNVTHEYRYVALNNCSFDTSVSVFVRMTPKFYSSDVTKIPTVSSASICAGDPVTSLALSSVTTSNIQQWLYRDNGGNWNTFVGNNLNTLTDNNTNVSSTTTRDYVAIYNSVTPCRIDTSGILSVTIKPVVRGVNTRIPVVPASVCTGNIFSFGLTVSSDTTIRNWIYSLNGGPWTMTSIAYRAITLKASTCRMDTTQISTVIPKTKVFGSDTSLSATVLTPYCALSTSNLATVVPGNGNSVYYWAYSDDGTTWNAIYTTSVNLTGVINTQQTINRKYRALIQKPSCNIDSTKMLNVVINPPVYGSDTAEKVTVSAPKSVCGGSSVTLTATAAGSVINKWLYRDIKSPNWNILNTSTSLSIADNNSTIQSSRLYSFIGYKSTTCHLDTAAVMDTGFFNPRTRGVDTSIKVTSTVVSICAGNQISLNVQGLGTNTVMQWLYSDNSGKAWNNLSIATSTSFVDYNTDIPITLTRMYRVIVKKTTGCTIDSSDVISVMIRARVNSRNTSNRPVLNNNSFCSGSIISANFTVLSGRTIQKWLTSVNSGPWTEYVTSVMTYINDSNTNVSAKTTKRYAIIQTSVNCTLDTSNYAEATIYPTGNGSQLTIIPGSGKTFVCSGSTIKMGVKITNGSKIIKWIYRDHDTDPWTSISNSADTLIDSNTNISVSVNRKYRLILLNPSGCNIDTSGTGAINIYPITNGTASTNVQANSSIICTGTQATLSISPAAGYQVEQWLRKTGTQPWAPFTTSTTNVINDTNTNLPSSVVRQYSVRLKNTAGCNTDTSGSATVEIKLVTHGTNTTYTPYSAISSICSGTAVTVSIFGNTGIIKYWMSRDSLSNQWKIINLTDNIITDTSTTVSALTIRDYRVYLFDPNNCRYDTSGSFKLTIIPNLPGNAPTITPTVSSALICRGSSVTISANGFINNGTVKAWLYSDNNGAWNKIDFSDSSTYHHNTTNVTSQTVRKYRALVLTGCYTDTTAAKSITIDIFPYKPIILRKQNSDTLTSSETASTYQWKLNGSNITGSTKVYHIAQQNGKYHVEIGNSSGCKTLSDSLMVINLGLSSINGSGQILLYPNPTTDGKIKVQFNGFDRELVQMEVMNVLGEKVFSKQFISGNGAEEIDLSTKQDGVYIVQFDHKGDKAMYRLVISK